MTEVKCLTPDSLKLPQYRSTLHACIEKIGVDNTLFSSATFSSTRERPATDRDRDRDRDLAVKSAPNFPAVR